MLIHKTGDTQEKRDILISSFLSRGYTQVSTKGLYIGNEHLLFDDGKPDPIKFIRVNSVDGFENRLKHIEEWLEKKGIK